MSAWYRVEECSDDADRILAADVSLSPTSDSWDIRDAATSCANDYHARHDGWEVEWPLTFVLYVDEDGQELARVKVERDVAPVFSAGLPVLPTGKEGK